MPARRFRQLWLWWAFVSLLAILCATLGVLQSRWLDEISDAQQDRLRASLNAKLNRLSWDFDQRIGAFCTGLVPAFDAMRQLGSKDAVALQYQHWRAVNGPVFRQIGLARLRKNGALLFLLDFGSGTFAQADWPANWSGMRERMNARGSLDGRGILDFRAARGNPDRGHLADLPPLPAAQSALLDFSLFGSAHNRMPSLRPDRNRGRFEPPLEDWLILELNTEYVRFDLLPQMIGRHLEQAGSRVYDAKVVVEAAPQLVIVADTGEAFAHADATTGLLNPSRIQDSPDIPNSRGTGIPGERELRPPPPDGGPSRWRLLIHERGSFLEGAIGRARFINLGISAAILFLILMTVVVLLRFSRKTEQLAALQMNFVAGVSHELRTPLTVIRTAAFNLRGSVSRRPEQVEKYGALIQSESEKLTLLVDQVLRYGAATSGRIIGPLAAADAAALVEHSLQSCLALAARPDVAVEKQIETALPMILADQVSLRHALQNLIENAVKYGLGTRNWIGVSAAALRVNTREFVEISVSDRGPGIPQEEQARLFDAFYRGKRALGDQLHGTGLGLNIARGIIEAHGGTIRVQSALDQGATFIVRLPAASPGEPQPELPEKESENVLPSLTRRG